MAAKLRTMFRRLIPALLLGEGFFLNVLSLLGLIDHLLPGALILGGLLLMLSLASMNRITAILSWVGMLLSGVVWLLAMGGTVLAGQIINAVYLCVNGQNAALPMFAEEASLFLSVIMVPAAWLFSSKNGSWAAIAVTLILAAASWMLGMEASLIFLFPAAAASLTLVTMETHEGISMVRVLPLMAACCLAALLGAGHGIISEPLSRSAEDLRRTITDYLFFTEPRNVFSLSAEGYYPQGTAQLGGAVTPSDHPVMQVTAPKKVYLRGTIKNDYTGRIWRDTTGGRRYQWSFPSLAEQREQLFDMALPAGALDTGALLAPQKITVRMMSASASSLFVPQRIREIYPGGDLVLYFNNASELFVTRDLQEGSTWTVSAPLMTAGEAGLGTLIKAAASSPDDRYADMVQTYTLLPDHIQSMVYDLARQITAGEETPYDQAMAIQNYLQRSFRYTLEVEPQPSDMDFVTNFLFNTKEGYCTYFASAMTVLCRMVGLPARYVEGYLAVPDDQGTAYVTGRNAHAWTEVYFSGFGWLTFDATPAGSTSDPGSGQPEGGGDPQEKKADPPPPPEEDPQPDPDDHNNDQEQEDPPSGPQPDENGDRDPDDGDDSSAPPPTPEPNDPPEDDQEPPQTPPPDLKLLWPLLFLLLLAALLIRILMMRPEHREKKLKDSDARFELWVQALGDLLMTTGRGRHMDESPLCWMRRLESEGSVQIRLESLGRLLSMRYYGKLIPTDEDADSVRQARRMLWNSLTRRKQLQILLLQAFVPLKKRDALK